MAVNNRDSLQFDINSDEIESRIAELASVSKTVVSARKAVREAINIIKNQAVSNARAIDDGGTRLGIFKNIKTQNRKTRKKTNVRFRLGVDKKREFWAMHRKRIEVIAGVRRKVDNPFYGTLGAGATPYWHFVELGTRHSRARPFMLPALTAKSRQATMEFNRIFLQELDRQIANARVRRQRRSAS